MTTAFALNVLRAKATPKTAMRFLGIHVFAATVVVTSLSFVPHPISAKSGWALAVALTALIVFTWAAIVLTRGLGALRDWRLFRRSNIWASVVAMCAFGGPLLSAVNVTPFHGSPDFVWFVLAFLALLMPAWALAISLEES